MGVQSIVSVREGFKNSCSIEKNEMLDLKKMSSERGEISKSDLVVYIKQSKMWRGIMESKPKSSSQSKTITKVGDKSKVVKTAFKVLDLDKDGYITKDEFSQASKTLDADQIEIVFQRFDTNKDGRLSKEEFQQLMEKHAH